MSASFSEADIEAEALSCTSTLFKAEGDGDDGGKGEGEGETALNFITRYFEVQPGGYSTLEHHQHPHSVVILRGRGVVILEDRVEPLALHDCVYVAPGAWHQFHATGEEPLGFLCVVDRQRDRPVLPEEDDLERLGRSPEVGRRLRS